MNDSMLHTCAGQLRFESSNTRCQCLCDVLSTLMPALLAPEHCGFASLGGQPHIKGRRGQLAELPVCAIRVVHADPCTTAGLRMEGGRIHKR